MLPLDDETVSGLIRGIDLVGVAGNALLGGAVARSNRLDLVGFFVLAVLSGLGGGMIRDVLLGQGTVVALTDSAYLFTAVIAALVIYVVNLEGRLWDVAWPIIDALSIGCWAVVGSQRALEAGLGWLPALLLGTLTAVGGGAVRDVILNKVPSVLGGNTLAATCAVLASATVVIFDAFGITAIGSLVAILVGSVTNLAARARGWTLPEPEQATLSRVAQRRRESGVSLRDVARQSLENVRRSNSRRPARTDGQSEDDGAQPDDQDPQLGDDDSRPEDDEPESGDVEPRPDASR